MRRIRGLAALTLAGLVLVAGGCGDDGESGSGTALTTPDYEGFVEDVESDPSSITRVTVTAGEKSVVVEDSTGSSYELDVPEGDADSLLEKLKQAGIEVDAPKQ